MICLMMCSPMLAMDDENESGDTLTADESEAAFETDNALLTEDDLLDDAPPVVAVVDAGEPDHTLMADESEAEYEADSALAVEEAQPDVPPPASLSATESAPAARLSQLHHTGAAQLERGDIAAAIASLSAALSLAEGAGRRRHSRRNSIPARYVPSSRTARSKPPSPRWRALSWRMNRVAMRVAPPMRWGHWGTC